MKKISSGWLRAISFDARTRMQVQFDKIFQDDTLKL